MQQAEPFAARYLDLVYQTERGHRAPTPREVEAWQLLKNVTHELFKQHELHEHIIPQDDGHYYDNAWSMGVAMRVDGWIYIDSADSDHPSFSVDENIMFRAVHDILGHLRGDSQPGSLPLFTADLTQIYGFNWKGEWMTHALLEFKYRQAALAMGYSEQERDDIARALETENLGQTGYSVWHHNKDGETHRFEFLPQHIGFLDPERMD